MSILLNSLASFRGQWVFQKLMELIPKQMGLIPKNCHLWPKFNMFQFSLSLLI